MSMGLFLSELTLAISQRTFGLYSETCLIRHYAEPNNYVEFDRVSEYTGISITRKVEQLCQVGQFSNALIFFAINCRRKNTFTHKLKANTFNIKIQLKFSNQRYKPIPNNKSNLILSFITTRQKKE